MAVGLPFGNVDADERQAITRMKRGEIGAMALLVERYQVKAVRAAYLITQDVRTAEDVVQETYLNVYHHIHQFDENRRFEPWFLRSVCNAAIKAVQRQKRTVSLDGDAGNDHNNEDWTLAEQLVAGTQPVYAVVEAAETKERIRRAMQQLSPRMRAAVVQRYFLDMSEKEMAEELDSPPGTVKWLLNAAKKQLRGLLDPESRSFYD
jgi:RNA polymerase sigma-70 factor, ECF subfamily